MNNLNHLPSNEENLSSGCLISINEYGQFLLTYADSVFFNICKISNDAIGKSIDSSFNPKFVTYLKEMYNTYDSSSLLIKSRTGNFILYLDDKKSVNLSVSLYLEKGKPKFKCLCSDTNEKKNLSLLPDNFTYCLINGDLIVSSSENFKNFIEVHAINEHFFTDLKLVKDTLKNQLPTKKLINVPDSYGNPYLYYITCIPGDNTSQSSAMIFINKPDKDSRLKEINNLTPRELEIIKLASLGLTNRAISMKLNISEGCVKKTLSNAYPKLGIESRMEIYDLF